MRTMVCAVVAGLPVALALGLARRRVAEVVAGKAGRWWCLGLGLGAGLIPALAAAVIMPTTGSGGLRQVAWAVFALPLWVGAAWLWWCSGRSSRPRDPSPDTARVPAEAPQDPASVVPAPTPEPKAPDAVPETSTAARPAPAPTVEDTPTTVTECILTMGITCEEYLLQNLARMAEAPLSPAQREAMARLLEETDDKLARLRAARERHHGEEVVRILWSQLPEVNLPVVPPGASVEEVREQARTQTEAMVDFYRTMATYVDRASLKNLLVTLALDGQRHLSVLEQSAE